ncbi:MAG: glycoside hydrolase family 15 protein, partial [Phycisphaerales bacterium]
FARMATPLEDGTYRLDMTLDASAFGLFEFGALPADDPRVVAHMEAIRDRLWVKTEIGGLARYENDYYHQIEHQNVDEIPGNPWIICTLWLALWHIAKATTTEELAEALPYLEWTQARALPSGVLAEQVNPYDGQPISVSPLTWSHATVVTTITEYLLKHAELTGKSSGCIAELAMSRPHGRFSPPGGTG